MIAWAFSDMEQAGIAFSIEMLRACMESAPTWPECWTREQGKQFVSDFTAV